MSEDYPPLPQGYEMGARKLLPRKDEEWEGIPVWMILARIYRCAWLDEARRLNDSQHMMLSPAAMKAYNNAESWRKWEEDA